jgi:hypothetical protein
MIFYKENAINIFKQIVEAYVIGKQNICKNYLEEINADIKKLQFKLNVDIREYISYNQAREITQLLFSIEFYDKKHNLMNIPIILIFNNIERGIYGKINKSYPSYKKIFNFIKEYNRDIKLIQDEELQPRIYKKNKIF